MSNLTLISDALSMIGVLPEAQEASAEQGTLALRLVDEMVGEWNDDGVIVSWDSKPRLDDDCHLMGTEMNAVKYGLAVRLCPHYGRMPTPDILGLAAAAYTRLARQQMARGLQPMEVSMPKSESGYGYDILTDE
jgi:hypothetical protein